MCEKDCCTCTMALCAVAAIFVIYMLKQYFSGGVCKLKRNLTNQIVIITGSNTGIGKETARRLAQNGATIILANRSEERTKEILTELQQQYGKDKAVYIPLDLNDQESIKKFAQEFKQKYNQLHILLNNAGIMALPKRETTKQGLEKQTGVNHFGHFLLTGLLLEVLKKTPKSRVINVSSLAHKFAGPKEAYINFDDLQWEKNYDTSLVYSQSKLANVLFTKELQRRFDEHKLEIKTACLHPGVVRTELMRYNGMVKLITNIIYPLFWIGTKTPTQGAQTNIQLCLEEYDNLQEGEYYSDCKVASISKNGKNMEDAKRLFEMSEKIVNFKYEF